jgi:hypothetical protein
MTTVITTEDTPPGYTTRTPGLSLEMLAEAVAVKQETDALLELLAGIASTIAEVRDRGRAVYPIGTRMVADFLEQILEQFGGNEEMRHAIEDGVYHLVHHITGLSALWNALAALDLDPDDVLISADVAERMAEMSSNLEAMMGGNLAG